MPWYYYYKCYHNHYNNDYDNWEKGWGHCCQNVMSRNPSKLALSTKTVVRSKYADNTKKLIL